EEGCTVGAEAVAVKCMEDDVLVLVGFALLHGDGLVAAPCPVDLRLVRGQRVVLATEVRVVSDGGNGGGTNLVARLAVLATAEGVRSTRVVGEHEVAIGGEHELAV